MGTFSLGDSFPRAASETEASPGRGRALRLPSEPPGFPCGTRGPCCHVRVPGVGVSKGVCVCSTPLCTTWRQQAGCELVLLPGAVCMCVLACLCACAHVCMCVRTGDTHPACSQG